MLMSFLDFILLSLASFHDYLKPQRCSTRTPLTLYTAVAYKGRTAESKALTKEDSTEAGSNQANDSLQDPLVDDSAPATDQPDLLLLSSTVASSLHTAAGIAPRLLLPAHIHQKA